MSRQPPTAEPIGRGSGLGWAAEQVSRGTGPAPHDIEGFGPAPAPGTLARAAAVTSTVGAPANVVPAVAPAPRSFPTAPDTSQRAASIVRERRTRRPLPRPATPRVFVVANQKGGVGKTTTAVNLAAALAQLGARVLLIDLDPQGNASTALGINHDEGSPGVYEALVDSVPLRKLIRPTAVPGLTAVPATIDLVGAEIELVTLPEREHRLRSAVVDHLAQPGAAEDRLDYVFVDCPPSLGLLTLNALVAGRELLVPIQCEYYALEGVGQLMRNVELVQAHLNPGLAVSTVLLTMHDGRTRLSAAVADEVRAHFGDRVLRTTIPRSVRISEAPSFAQTVMTYDPTSAGALCYVDAAREVAHMPVPPTPEEDV